MSENTDNPEIELEQQIETEEVEIEEKEPTDEPTVDDLKKDLAKKDAQLKRLLKKKVNTKEVTKETTNQDSEQRIERLELKQDGYSDKVIEQIMDLGGKAALSNEIVKNAVDGMVQKERVEKASAPDGASRSMTKTNVPLEELKNMSSAEMAKHLPKAQ